MELFHLIRDGKAELHPRLRQRMLHRERKGLVSNVQGIVVQQSVA